MKKMIICVAAFGCVMLLGGMVIAGISGPEEIVLESCSKELDTYCKNVTPGDGRNIACLYAYGDKLSNRCEYALYDAVVQLERLLIGLSYLANECRDDIKTYCSGIQPGQGRLYECLDKKKDAVSARCKSALKDVK